MEPDCTPQKQKKELTKVWVTKTTGSMSQSWTCLVSSSLQRAWGTVSFDRERYMCSSIKWTNDSHLGVAVKYLQPTRPKYTHKGGITLTRDGSMDGICLIEHVLPLLSLAVHQHSTLYYPSCFMWAMPHKHISVTFTLSSIESQHAHLTVSTWPQCTIWCNGTLKSMFWMLYNIQLNQSGHCTPVYFFFFVWMHTSYILFFFQENKRLITIYICYANGAVFSDIVIHISNEAWKCLDLAFKKTV